MITFYSLYTICIQSYITFIILNVKFLVKKRKKLNFKKRTFLHHMHDFLILIKAQRKMMSYLVRSATQFSGEPSGEDVYLIGCFTKQNSEVQPQSFVFCISMEMPEN